MTEDRENDLTLPKTGIFSGAASKRPTQEMLDLTVGGSSDPVTIKNPTDLLFPGNANISDRTSFDPSAQQMIGSITFAGEVSTLNLNKVDVASLDENSNYSIAANGGTSVKFDHTTSPECPPVMTEGTNLVGDSNTGEDAA